jgi:putative ATPase
VLGTITRLAAGDARVALSLLDLALNVPDDGSVSDTKLLGMIRQAASVSYDRTGEAHYDTISALHKSVRSSDGNAAMFWLARMLTSGEDPLFIARRLVVMASEDIGLADSHALPLVSPA